MNNIVVTGGSGYIGSHLVNLFAKNGYNVFSLDKESWSGDLHNSIKTYIVNLQNYNEIVNVFKEIDGIDCIIHCAGELGIRKSFSQKELFYQQNVFVTDCMLNAAIQFHVKNFIFASSAAVYASSYLPSSINSSLDKKPSPYALTKVLCEERIKRISEYTKVNYVIFRYFNVIGCDCNCETTKRLYLDNPNLFPKLINAFYNDTLFVINGNQYKTIDGTCIRDYINVCDLAELHLLAYRKMISNEWKSCFNGIYNAGSGCPNSIIDIIHSFQEISKKELNVIVRGKRKGDCPYLCADIDLTKKTFGWKPKTTIKDTFTSLLSCSERNILYKTTQS